VSNFLKDAFVECSKCQFPGNETLISFAVNYGDIVCFADTGSNGLALLSCIAGLELLIDGAIVIDGELIEDSSCRPLLIRGGRRLSARQTAREHLQLFVDKNIEEYLSSLSVNYLVPWLDSYIGDVSFSIRQDFEVVMSIASGVTCLLLHRPFEGIDDGQRNRLESLLRKYVSKGCAVIYTATSPVLYKYADRVANVTDKNNSVKDKSAKDKSDETALDNNSDNSESELNESDSKLCASGVFVSGDAYHHEFLSYLEGRIKATGRLGEALFDPLKLYGGLMPRLTVEEHFAYYFKDLELIEVGHVHRKRLRGCVLEIFDSYSFAGVEPSAYPEELSSFNCIALNLMIQLSRLPEVLYCWYPVCGIFSKLLPSEREKIFRLINRYVSSGGKCIIFSDNLITLKTMADKVVVSSPGESVDSLINSILISEEKSDSIKPELVDEDKIND